MKKDVNIILIVLYLIGLSGCYQDLKKDSLDEYIIHINKNEHGYSETEIDHPKYFLPTTTFLEDFLYLNGFYYWREDDPLRGVFSSKVNPEISFLKLTYEENDYLEAKGEMLRNIESYNNKLYSYNEYIFYENTNFVNIKYESSHLPEHFTMACYNDYKFTLIFIGFCSITISARPCIDEKYINNFDENFTSFIDQYYGEYYDFSK